MFMHVLELAISSVFKALILCLQCYFLICLRGTEGKPIWWFFPLGSGAVLATGSCGLDSVSYLEKAVKCSTCECTCLTPVYIREYILTYYIRRACVCLCARTNVRWTLKLSFYHTLQEVKFSYFFAFFARKHKEKLNFFLSRLTIECSRRNEMDLLQTFKLTGDTQAPHFCSVDTTMHAVLANMFQPRMFSLLWKGSLCDLETKYVRTDSRF